MVAGGGDAREAPPRPPRSPRCRRRRRRRYCCGGRGGRSWGAAPRGGAGAAPGPKPRRGRDEALKPSMAGPGPTFPLHRLVWANRHRELEAALHSRQVRPRRGTRPVPQHDIEQEDPRGRTPLELAVSLGNLESVRVLLRHNANVGKENRQGWAGTAEGKELPRDWQEAVSTGDPEMVQLVLQYRDYQRATQRLAGIPELLNKLRQVQQGTGMEQGDLSVLTSAQGRVERDTQAHVGETGSFGREVLPAMGLLKNADYLEQGLEVDSVDYGLSLWNTSYHASYWKHTEEPGWQSILPYAPYSRGRLGGGHSAPFTEEDS
ncbi:hypothetical protein P7K49_021409 [Saguinus oedipus]|uniref:Uncharacterized protein n=1 Tax=Saguinus oedipus TaxID=9490 RepID=A0ABQ9USN0_SAGOE|nr:hypothetical protein P7K49_021409 [Saguinus oedipus]